MFWTGGGSCLAFQSHPSDAQIRPHANLAPEKFTDRGNMVLDQAFLILRGLSRPCLYWILSPVRIRLKEYGTRGERSAAGSQERALQAVAHSYSAGTAGGFGNFCHALPSRVLILNCRFVGMMYAESLWVASQDISIESSGGT